MAGLARSPARMRRVHTLTPVALGVALVLWASAFAGIRAGLKGYGPGELALLRFLVASFVYVPDLVVQVRAAPVGATPAVVYLGVFPAAVAYVAWSWALARAEASVVASSLYLLPPISILIAGVWLGETPTMLSLLGGLVTILGVALINTGGTRRGAASTSAAAAP